MWFKPTVAMKPIRAVLLAIAFAFASGALGADELIVKNTAIERGAKGNALVVLIHGYTLNGDTLKKVQAAIRRVKGLENADFLRPDMPLGLLSTASISRITAELLAAIDNAWNSSAELGRPYERIVIVGHSMGALLARKVYVAAAGENPEAPFENELKRELAALNAWPVDAMRPWSCHVDRIVLLAGMNRGWSISHHMSLLKAAEMKVGVAVGHVVKWIEGSPPAIFAIRRGSPFITELRLQWLAMLEHGNGHRNAGAHVREQQDKECDRAAGGTVRHAGSAVTVQLLGTIDDLVSPDDNVDLVTGREFFYLEVPASGHRNVIEMDDSREGSKRQQALMDAFDDVEVLRNKPSPMAAPLPERREVKDVVFVIHGIRDEGYWTRKIAFRTERDAGDRVATVTSSYGYFPMLSFLRPGARQEKVEWLMDRYTEAKAMYPEARFHYVGHSHGTYLLAKALEDYPAVRFDRVVFAGSVVNRGEKWLALLRSRVSCVVNFVATADWVVAFFPKALQSVGIQDLGSAGHDGFGAASMECPVIEPPQTYIVGGHAAALHEAMWDSIAKFTLTGVLEPPPVGLQSSTQEQLVAWPAKFSPLIWLIIAALLLWGAYGLARLPVREWKKTLAIVLYCGVIWAILTEL
jgi:pimeloyl-ACP methyl ester carboxylesterase